MMERKKGLSGHCWTEKLPSAIWVILPCLHRGRRVISLPECW